MTGSFQKTTRVPPPPPRFRPARCISNGRCSSPLGPPRSATLGHSLRGAIDDFIELATREATTMSTALLLDRPLVQSTVARAEAILNAARAYVLDAVGRAWEAFQANDPDPTPLITQARLSITHGMHEAVRTVDLVFHAAGTNAVYTRNSLERHFRDIHVAVQHGAALPGHFEIRWQGSDGYSSEGSGLVTRPSLFALLSEASCHEQIC